MKRCKNCHDYLIFESHDFCVPCFEKQHKEKQMNKSIEDYQKELKLLKSARIDDSYIVERLSTENEKLKKELKCLKETETITVKEQRDILDKTLFELPVGNVKTHIYENIPDRVKYFVREYAILEQEKDAVDELIAKTMPNFFDNPKAGSILDNVTILIEMANKAMLDEWVESEKLERLEEEIETFYEYYAGFGAKKDLTSTQMLNHILQKVPNYKPTKTEQDYEVLKRHCDRFIKALDEICKKNRKADTCRMIALEALGELYKEDYQPELLLEENLKLRMQVEDLETKLADTTLEKAFSKESHPLMDCPDCGKYWDYHHEEHCEKKLLDKAEKLSKLYP